MPPRLRPNVELVDLDSLRPHPRNPRQGDIGSIASMIATTGWHTVVTVQRKPRGRDVTLAGWHRSEALRALVRDGWTDPATGERITYDELAERVTLPPKGKVPIEPLRISDDVALQKLIQDNRANDLAYYDEELLAADLRALAEIDALEGTGFDGDDVDDLIARAHAGEPDLAGVRRGDAPTGDHVVRYGVVVECRDESDQRGLLEELLARGLNVRALTT